MILATRDIAEGDGSSDTATARISCSSSSKYRFRRRSRNKTDSMVLLIPKLVPMDDLARFATREGIRDENAYLEEFSAWLREVVLPRVQGRRDQ